MFGLRASLAEEGPQAETNIDRYMSLDTFFLLNLLYNIAINL